MIVKGEVSTSQKNASIKGEPVLVFDNKIKTGSIELLTVPEVADILKISSMGVRRLQQGRHLPFIKVGGSVRFLKDDVTSYLQRMRVESVG